MQAFNETNSNLKLINIQKKIVRLMMVKSYEQKKTLFRNLNILNLEIINDYLLTFFVLRYFFLPPSSCIDFFYSPPPPPPNFSDGPSLIKSHSWLSNGYNLGYTYIKSVVKYELIFPCNTSLEDTFSTLPSFSSSSKLF